MICTASKDLFVVGCNFGWTMCVVVCANDDRSMSILCPWSFYYGGSQALVRSKAPDALWIHCIIHREPPASMYLGSALNLVLKRAVNF